MKRKSIALLLVLSLVLSLCAVSALAEEEGAEEIASPENEEAAELAVPGSPAGPDPVPTVDPETGKLLEEVAIVPDAVGTVSFANIENRMREKNLTVLTLQQSIESLRDIDYKKMEDDVRDGLNEIANQQWQMHMVSSAEPMAAQLVLAELQQQYDATRETFDAIRDGELQKDNEALIKQLQDGQDQVIMAGESTYIALKALETQEAALQRQLSAMNRTVEEMELRYTMGQISALNLSQAKMGRTAVASGMETLQMNIELYKAQLEMLLGAELTGEILLGQVPEVTAEQLAAMDLEKDLEAAKAISYELYAAAETLADAKETYEDEADEYNHNEKKQEFRAAKRTWQAAQYTYNETVQNYEMKFRTLYAQVQDCKQVLEAAKVTLACQQESYAASELKYQQGTISQNALLDAGDSLKEAEEKVQGAAQDLFSTYNNYCWAVQRGILN